MNPELRKAKPGLKGERRKGRIDRITYPEIDRLSF
jgi:hypothetical protein